MKRKLHRILLFLLLANVDAVAQTAGFNYSADIKPVDSSGFYNIVLIPELNAHLKIDYSDLRVVNDPGKWVPHLLNPEWVQHDVVSFLNLPIIENNNSLLRTTLVVENKDSLIDNIVLTMGNTNAKRFCTLKGGDDKVNWYIVTDSILINPISDNNKESFTSIRFPSCSYKYFQIEIDNKGNGPLNILKANTSTIFGEVTGLKRTEFLNAVANPLNNIYQKDSGKISFIKVEQNKFYHFNKISLQISGAKYFNRAAELYIPASGNHSFSNPGINKQSFTLSNNSTLDFDVPLGNPKIFYVLIHNEDNPPLKIKALRTFINYRVATVYLEKSKHYNLLLDNISLANPKYDLNFNNIPYQQNIQTASIGKIVSLQKPTPAIQQKPNSKKYIWLALALAAIVLGFFTYRLITDMNKQKT